MLDGTPTDLNMYVRSVFINVAKTLIGTLKNVSEPTKIEIRVEKKDCVS